MTAKFEDRSHAGRQLADRLAPLISRPCVVVAVPRGGVVVAEPIAERLEAPLTVVYVRKLTSPTAPGVAFGAMAEDGSVILDRETTARLALTPADIAGARAHAAAETRRCRELYREARGDRHAHGMSAVLVDDGLATGLTLRAAILSLYRRGVSDITVAVPCAENDAAVRLHLEVDGLVCPVMERRFEGLERYYADFSPVSDEEVMAILAYTRAARRAGPVGV